MTHHSPSDPIIRKFNGYSFASSVMLLASKVQLYTEAERETEKALDAAATELGMARE